MDVSADQDGGTTRKMTHRGPWNDDLSDPGPVGTHRNVWVDCPSWVTCPGANLADGWEAMLPPSFHLQGELDSQPTCHGDEGYSHLLGGEQAVRPNRSWGY